MGGDVYFSPSFHDAVYGELEKFAEAGQHRRRWGNLNLNHLRLGKNIGDVKNFRKGTAVSTVVNRLRLYYHHAVKGEIDTALYRQGTGK